MILWVSSEVRIVRDVKNVASLDGVGTYMKLIPTIPNPTTTIFLRYPTAMLCRW